VSIKQGQLKKASDSKGKESQHQENGVNEKRHNALSIKRQSIMLCLLIVFPLVLSALILAQAPVKCPGALTEKHLKVLIEGEVPKSRVREYIDRCGIAFAVTPEVEARLKIAGASAGLVELIKKKQPTAYVNDTVERFKHVMLHLEELYDKTKMDTDSAPGVPGPPYSPQNPNWGVNGLYALVRFSLDFPHLERLSGLSIFASGPHDHSTLDLGNKNDFGHYSISFVEWCSRQVALTLQDQNFIQRSRPLFDRYIKRRARTYYYVYRTLIANPAFFEEERQRYISAIKSGNAGAGHLHYLYFERKRSNTTQRVVVEAEKVNDDSLAILISNLRNAVPDYEEYETSTSIGFWIRRRIDETDREFFNLLQMVMRAYDPSILNARLFDTNY
jgi:hypothetical protein